MELKINTNDFLALVGLCTIKTRLNIIKLYLSDIGKNISDEFLTHHTRVKDKIKKHNLVFDHHEYEDVNLYDEGFNLFLDEDNQENSTRIRIGTYTLTLTGHADFLGKTYNGKTFVLLIGTPENKISIVRLAFLVKVYRADFGIIFSNYDGVKIYSKQFLRSKFHKWSHKGSFLRILHFIHTAKCCKNIDELEGRLFMSKAAIGW